MKRSNIHVILILGKYIYLFNPHDSEIVKMIKIQIINVDWERHMHIFLLYRSLSFPQNSIREIPAILRVIFIHHVGLLIHLSVGIENLDIASVHFSNIVHVDLPLMIRFVSQIDRDSPGGGCQTRTHQSPLLPSLCCLESAPGVWSIPDLYRNHLPWSGSSLESGSCQEVVC